MFQKLYVQLWIKYGTLELFNVVLLENTSGFLIQKFDMMNQRKVVHIV